MFARFVCRIHVEIALRMLREREEGKEEKEKKKRKKAIYQSRFTVLVVPNFCNGASTADQYRS